MHGALLAQALKGALVTKEPIQDRLFTVAETAKLMSCSKDWIYERWRELPFSVRNGRSLRFSVLGLQKYLRQR